ncbi:MAG: hypothetical protein ABL894_09490, partial [Hyphomicrobium sp.]
MLMLLLQIFLILLAAFLTGAALACLLKRVILGEPVAEAVPVREAAAPAKTVTTPPAKVAEPSSPNVDRFGRALSGSPVPAAAVISKPSAPVVEVQPPAPAPRPAASPTSAASEVTVAKPAPAPVQT